MHARSGTLEEIALYRRAAISGVIGECAKSDLSPRRLCRASRDLLAGHRRRGSSADKIKEMTIARQI